VYGRVVVDLGGPAGLKETLLVPLHEVRVRTFREAGVVPQQNGDARGSARARDLMGSIEVMYVPNCVLVCQVCGGGQFFEVLPGFYHHSRPVAVKLAIGGVVVGAMGVLALGVARGFHADASLAELFSSFHFPFADVVVVIVVVL
jgi:hypothetical protein